MLKEDFEALVEKAFDNLPEEFRERLENVDIFVEDWPTRDQLAEARIKHKGGLLGLYEGIPVTERGHNYNLVLPDRITIFQKPVESVCSTPAETQEEVEHVLLHEIGHYFGFSEEQLVPVEEKWRRTRGHKT